MGRIWTVGHSNHAIERFIELLTSNGMEAVADVRRFPGSRRWPHFSAAAFREHLAAAGIEYHPFAELGGRRKAGPASKNTAWRNAGFRGYADYLETEAFREAAGRLVELSERKRAAVMCAEALWWRCHRSLIADYLKAAGHIVLHITPAGKVEEHPYTSAARIADGRLSYAEPDLPPGGLFGNRGGQGGEAPIR